MSTALQPALSLATPARSDVGAGRSAPPGPAAAAVAMSSEALLRGNGELLIDHHGTLYRLKKTSSGKLILTK